MQGQKKHARSVIHSKSEGCFVCMQQYGKFRAGYLEEHHIFGGANRKWSEMFGLKLYLCMEHHNASKESAHADKDLRNYLHVLGQKAFERDHTREEFRSIFGQDYIAQYGEEFLDLQEKVDDGNGFIKIEGIEDEKLPW